MEAPLMWKPKHLERPLGDQNKDRRPAIGQRSDVTGRVARRASIPAEAAANGWTRAERRRETLNPRAGKAPQVVCYRAGLELAHKNRRKGVLEVRIRPDRRVGGESDQNVSRCIFRRFSSCCPGLIGRCVWFPSSRRSVGAFPVFSPMITFHSS